MSVVGVANPLTPKRFRSRLGGSRMELRPNHAPLSALALLLATACTDPAPPSSLGDVDGECAPTSQGRACIVLRISVDDAIRDDAEPGRLVGVVHWGIYRGGDVGLFGPHDGTDSLLGGDSPEPVDLSARGSHHDVVLKDMAAIEYQVLGFLGPEDEAGDAIEGDPVTFPSDPFPAHADRRNLVEVLFNYIR
ncbi:MAG: hypothetical protein HYV07_25005 [Deltaproteobacteria bacterium]|nr:hypothetical protein [Deltaproteobacteria bacterium]